MTIFFNKSFLITILVCASAISEATEISPLLGVGQDNFSFKIQSLGGATKEIEYEPNIPGLSRVGLSALGYGVSYSIRGAEAENQNFGKTSFTDFQLGYHNENWGIDGFYQTYKGFYIKNSSTFGGNSDSPYTFPDLEFNHYAISARLARDNQGGFKLSSLLSQSDQIKKTAGTYYLLASYRYFSLINNSTILPASLSGINSDVDGIRKMAVNTINLGAGAGKYWVSDSYWFIGSCFDLIATYGLYRYTREPVNDSNSSYLTTSFNVKLGVGYSGDRFRAGISANGEITTLKAAASTYLAAASNQFMFYIRTAY